MLDKDKLWHYLAGFVVSLAMLLFCVSVLITFIVCTVIAVVKELFDTKYGTVDAMDAIVTILGGVTAIVVYTGS